MNFSKLFYRFITLCQTKPRWSLTKISKLVEVKVLNESHNTQCLGSVVPLAILTLCALNLKLFHISIGSQGASIWGETLDEDFELLCCEGYLVTVGGVRSILLPFTWHGRGGETSNATFLQNTGNFENKWHFLSAISCRQGCIFCLTCSYPELTEDHVLTKMRKLNFLEPSREMP